MPDLSYAIKEIYYTIQGEGAHSGRPAVFCRFSGCNLWSGLEKDRSSAICQFCDTDFWGTDGVHGGKYNAADLVARCASLWPDFSERPFVVCTGGEPLLQLDTKLVEAFSKKGWYIAIETNGTLPVPLGVDWICVSPKANTEIKVNKGNELKLVYPQDHCSPSQFETLDFEHFSLQPKDDTNRLEHTRRCVEYCMLHPKWKLSVQTHKYIGIP